MPLYLPPGISAPVANSSLATMAANTLKGNTTGGTATPSDNSLANILSWLSLSTNPGQPNFKATIGTNQGLTNNTNIVINFDTKTFDSNTYFNTSTHEFVPLVAGTYVTGANIRFNGTTTALANIELDILKNSSFSGGSVATVSLNNVPIVVSGDLAIMYCAGIVSLNGSTDFITVNGFINSSSETVNVTSANSSFWAYRIGP